VEHPGQPGGTDVSGALLVRYFFFPRSVEVRKHKIKRRARKYSARKKIKNVQTKGEKGPDRFFFFLQILCDSHFRKGEGKARSIRMKVIA
jgi:hypothetical protein